MLKNQPHSESATLFVGNLPFDATEVGLRDLIESNAPTKKPKIVKEDSDDDDNDDAEADGDDVKEEEAGADETEDAEVAEADEIEKAEQLHRGGQRSGLRKVRLGAFEDTGKCKG
jgi:RNA recognition motif-containing protein